MNPARVTRIHEPAAIVGILSGSRSNLFATHITSSESWSKAVWSRSFFIVAAQGLRFVVRYLI